MDKWSAEEEFELTKKITDERHESDQLSPTADVMRLKQSVLPKLICSLNKFLISNLSAVLTNIIWIVAQDFFHFFMYTRLG